MLLESNADLDLKTEVGTGSGCQLLRVVALQWLFQFIDFAREGHERKTSWLVVLMMMLGLQH